MFVCVVHEVNHLLVHVLTLNLCDFFPPHRATIEEVEGEVCELESKLDKVSTTHGKTWLDCSFGPLCEPVAAADPL